MGARLRASAAFAAAALCLHQLRYLAGHGDEASTALARQGHGYLGLVAPLVAILCGLALVQLVVALQRRVLPHRCRGGWRAAWPVAALALLTIYLVQETLEAALAAGHPAGLGGLLGSGGWVAVPLAIALGLAVALLLRGAEALLAARGGRPRRFTRPLDAARPTLGARRRRAAVLARHLAGRSPPLVCW